MNDLTDQQLLRDYVDRKSETAFGELVRRYVDLIHSAALRMVCDTHAAQDVTQGVFVLLARNARQLTNRPTLAGWLHCTARNLAAKAVRSDVRRRAREQEAAEMNEILSAVSDTSWEQIAPHLDDALGELDDTDRDALMLRYFKNHDLRTVGATLGISDDAAQKRVSRAVERLREFFAKRGVTVGAGGLAAIITANAVQAAPIGLALTISTAAALTGTTLATTATITATKAIAMTALQKTIVAATVAVLAGAGIYEARQAAQLRGQNQILQQQQAPLMEQIAELRNEREKAIEQQSAFQDSNDQLSRDRHELLKLRSEVGQLRQQLKTSKTQAAETKMLPQQDEVYRIDGEVRIAGPKHWTNGLSLGDVLQAAGGPTEHANLTNIKLRHKDGTLVTIDCSTNNSLALTTIFILPEDFLSIPRIQNE